MPLLELTKWIIDILYDFMERTHTTSPGDSSVRMTINMISGTRMEGGY